MPIVKNPIISGIHKPNTILRKVNPQKISFPMKDLEQVVGSDAGSAKNTPKKIIGLVTGALAGIGAYVRNSIKNRAIAKIDKKFDALSEDLPRVRDTFQNVFMREDIGIEETSSMLDRYRDIEKLKVTGKKDDYIKALFKEAKKNFGFEKADIPLVIEDEVQGNSACAGCTKDLMQYGIHIKRNSKKMSHMNIIHHELRHEKQNYIAINYDKEDYIKTSFKAVYDEALSNKNDFMHDCVKDKTFEQYYDEMKDVAKDDIFQIEQMYGKLDIANLSEKEIQFAKKCLGAKKTRIDGSVNFKEYKKNFLEQDAFKTGQMMDSLFK